MPSWRWLACVLPYAPTPPAAAHGPAACADGAHSWLVAADSLRSARTGYMRTYCRFCMTAFTLVADVPQPAPIALAWQPA